MLTVLVFVHLTSSRGPNTNLNPMVHDLRCSVRVFDENGRTIEEHKSFRKKCPEINGVSLSKGLGRPAARESGFISPKNSGLQQSSRNDSQTSSAKKLRSIVGSLSKTVNFKVLSAEMDRLQV